MNTENLKPTPGNWWRTFIPAVLLGAAVLSACSGALVPEEDAWGQDEWPIDLSTCPSSITCPKPKSPEDCKGSWWNTAGAGAPSPDCPAPPSSSCNTVVLGRCNAEFPDICKYRNCPGYIALNMKDQDWNIGENDRFIACAQAGLLDNQCKDIKVGSPSAHVPDPPAGDAGSVTYRELCQLKACGCPPTFKGDGGTATGCIGMRDGGTDGGAGDGGADAGGSQDAGARDGGSDAGTPRDGG